MVCHTAGLRDRLHELETVPLDIRGLRQSQRFKRPGVLCNRNVRPVGALFRLNAGGQNLTLEGLNQSLQLRWNRGRDQGRNLNQITAGAGFSKGKVAAEMALRQDIGGRKETYLIVMFRFVVQ